MSVSREGAALRSARKWLLLLCPEIPDRSGGKESLAVIVVKAAGYFGRSQRRHGMAYGAAGMQHGVAGAYKRRNTQGRVEGAFSYLSWRLCTGSCSAAGSTTRPDAGLRSPSIAAFGRSLPLAAVDRGSRPSAAAADRGIEISVATADPWIDSKNLRWHSPNFQVRQVKERATPPANFGPMSLDSNIDYRFCF